MSFIQREIVEPLNRRIVQPIVRRLFQRHLIAQTNNFRGLTWLGQPIWQSPLDVWNIQELLVAVRPELLIECGTNRGGLALFCAHLMDLMGYGRIITVDVEKIHSLCHDRITFLLGSSTAPEVASVIKDAAASCTGPIFVILDSDHSSEHVLAELETYGPLVTSGSYCMVQDGVIDVERMFAGSRPGPLDAIQRFLAKHAEFEVDHARCERFLVTHHPMGWLRRK